MVIYKKCIVALILMATLSSCTTKEMMVQLFNKNREQKLELSLETSYDTIFVGEDYPAVCTVELSNHERKPYYLEEPSWFQHNSFLYPHVYHVEYKKEDCSDCSVMEGEEMIRMPVPKYRLLKRGKPYVRQFSPMFSDLTCFGCEPNNSKDEKVLGRYQIRVYYIIDNDTIYSNPVTIHYLEK